MTELEKATWEFLFNTPSISLLKHGSPYSDLVEAVTSDREKAFIAGAEWQYEKFEKERLKHCDELTAEQAQMESDFVVQHLKNFNRTPTFIDAIEYGRNIASEQAMKYLQEHHSPSEVSDFQAAMNIAVAKAIVSTINKSIEWLKDNIHYDDFGGNMEWYVPFADDECMIQHFKTYMEE